MLTDLSKARPTEIAKRKILFSRAVHVKKTLKNENLVEVAPKQK